MLAGSLKSYINSKLILIAFIASLNTALFSQNAQHDMPMLMSTPMPSSAPSVAKKTMSANTPIQAKQPTNKNSLLKKNTHITPLGVKRMIDLVVNYKTVNFADKTRLALAINDQIPAPTLHFQQGDFITLNVYNKLDKPTAIHWHGLLVPWQMDGVEGVNQQAIPPGGVFHYKFKLYQQGTYWYHAHTGLQEQEGLYGAFIIDPPEKKSPYQYNKDYVVVLSDWSNTPAEEVLHNLKIDGDYYSPRFPLQPSLMKFLHDYNQADGESKNALLADYKMMQQMRMSIYDLSDVAYDAYLLNGQTKTHPWTAPVKIGDKVRLRFIGAAASTIYRVKIDGATMEMVHVQGNNVTPHNIDEFSIAPGETYDVLVHIKKNKPYIIYAESIDTLGKTYGALVPDIHHPIDYQHVPPFPEPKPVTQDMMANMMMTEMNHGAMDMTMPTEPSITGDTLTSDHSRQTTTSGTKYQHLSAAVKTNDANKPVDDLINMELFGYMGRYIWFINGLPEHKAKPILLQPNKRYRFVFTNNSMMRHPMHLHGHWFILRNGHGEYDPLLHTISVPPGATAVADVDTEASGQWFFHCHHLYHMLTGMSRVFQYSTLIELVKGTIQPQHYATDTAYINRPIVREDEVMPIDSSLVHHPMAHPPGFWFANFLDIGADPINNVQKLTFKGLYGSDYNKLELYSNDVEINKGNVENADIDLFYWHLISQFWAIKGGVNYFYRPAQKAYWLPGLGIEGLMPFFIDTNIRTYFYNGSAKLDMELSRDTQITNNGFLRLNLRGILATKNIISAQIGNGLNQIRFAARPYYRLMPGVNLFSEYEYTQNYGAFKTMQIREGDAACENTLTFGVSLLF